MLRGLALLIILVGPPAQAPERKAESAESFVAAIYDRYEGRDAKGTPLDTEAQVRRHFEPTLAALILEDRASASARGEVGKLDGDPFIDAQDWEIEAVAVAVRHAGADKASATVSFKNTGKPRTVVLDLVRRPEGWRIAEITWDRHATLRGILTAK